MAPRSLSWLESGVLNDWRGDPDELSACDCLKHFELPQVHLFSPTWSFIFAQYWILSLLQTSLTRISLRQWEGLTDYFWPTKNNPPVFNACLSVCSVTPIWSIHCPVQNGALLKILQDVSTQRIRSLGSLLRALGATTELCLYLKEINILKFLMIWTQNGYVYWNIHISPQQLKVNGLLKLL